MMGIGIAEARDLALWEFQALRTHWSERHGEKAPDFERMKGMMDARGAC